MISITMFSIMKLQNLCQKKPDKCLSLLVLQDNNSKLIIAPDYFSLSKKNRYSSSTISANPSRDSPDMALEGANLGNPPEEAYEDQGYRDHIEWVDPMDPLGRRKLPDNQWRRLSNSDNCSLGQLILRRNARIAYAYRLSHRLSQACGTCVS
jgi:hypothetical protein